MLWNGVWKVKDLGSRFLIWKDMKMFAQQVKVFESKVWKGLGQRGYGWWNVKLLRKVHLLKSYRRWFKCVLRNEATMQVSKIRWYRMPSMVLYQSHKQKRISDTNKWIYTNLLKQNNDTGCHQWTYTNLTKQKRISDTNKWIYTNLLR